MQCFHAYFIVIKLLSYLNKIAKNGHAIGRLQPNATRKNGQGITGISQEQSTFFWGNGAGQRTCHSNPIPVGRLYLNWPIFGAFVDGKQPATADRYLTRRESRSECVWAKGHCHK